MLCKHHGSIPISEVLQATASVEAQSAHQQTMTATSRKHEEKCHSDDTSGSSSWTLVDQSSACVDLSHRAPTPFSSFEIGPVLSCLMSRLELLTALMQALRCQEVPLKACDLVCQGKADCVDKFIKSLIVGVFAPRSHTPRLQDPSVMMASSKKLPPTVEMTKT